MQSGIKVSAEVCQQWNEKRADFNVSYMKFQIVNSDHVEMTASGKTTGDDFMAAASSNLLPKEPCYLLVRNGAESSKFVLVYYVPQNARVHDKMIYSSTLNTFKIALNAEHFSTEVHIATPEECNAKAIVELAHSHLDLMSVNELLAHESAYESVKGIATEAKVSVDLPVQVSSDVLPAVDAIKDGSVAAVMFTLNSETETLEVVSKGNETIDQIAATFTRENPRYCLFNFAHTNPNTGAAEKTVIFVYYCPDKARPKQKMFFSAAKSLVIKVIEGQGVPIKKEASFEATEAAEVSTTAVMTNLYPVVVEKKVIVKPKAAGRGAKTLGVKFSDF